MADDITRKLEELRRQAMAHLEEARAIVAQMNTVESLFDLPTTVLADLETAAVGAPSAPPFGNSTIALEARNNLNHQPKRRTGVIRPDEFFGDEPMEAAKKFMKSVGYAISFDEISDAVQKGGAALKGADWREKLEISLKRSPYQVITVADKTYGLAEFYTEDQLRRFRGARRRDTDSSTKSKTKPKAKPKSESAKQPSKGTASAKSKPKADTDSSDKAPEPSR